MIGRKIFSMIDMSGVNKSVHIFASMTRGAPFAICWEIETQNRTDWTNSTKQKFTPDSLDRNKPSDRRWSSFLSDNRRLCTAHHARCVRPENPQETPAPWQFAAISEAH